MYELGELLVVAGAGWMLLAGIGVLRFRDVYARMHAGTKATTLGLLLILVGTAVRSPTTSAFKLFLVVALLFVTAPVGTHLIGRSVHRSPGRARVQIDSVDELADAFDPETGDWR